MSWLNDIAYTYWGNYPIVVYLGILTYLLLLITAAIPQMNRRRWTRIPIKYHRILAYITAALATIHGLMVLASYL